jgi:CHASE2 domain-containing sensor protein
MLVVLVASLPLLLPVGGVYARYLDGNPRLPLVAELALLVGVVLVAGTVVLRRPRTVLAGSVLLGAVGAGAVWTGDVQPTAATLGLFVATTGVPILLLAGGLLAGVLDR